MNRVSRWATGVWTAILAAAAVSAADWPSFRGNEGQGVADGQSIPNDFDLANGRNVLWSVAISGQGHSSPIVTGQRVFVTSAEATALPDLRLGDSGGIDLARDEQEFSWRLYCLDASSGEVMWQREAFHGKPRAKRHVKSSQANSTPSTDGKTVVAIFGSQGMAAFDLAGNLLWKVDLGRLNPGLFEEPSSEWGYASSPVIHQDKVIVQVDRHSDSFLAAYRLASGELVWKTPRDERPVWATPVVARVGDHDELIVVGGYYNRGYDPETGRELWRFRDEAEVKTPTPFVAGGLIIFAGGYRGRPIYALRPGGQGDLSTEKPSADGPLVWRTEKGGPYTTTPLAYRGLLYAVRDTGVLHVYDLSDGERIYSQRTDATHASSPIASDGRIFLGTETGELLVVKAGRQYQELARIAIGEPVLATPAVSGGTLFLRSLGHLYAIRRRTPNS